MSLYLGWHCNWQCSSVLPVSGSRTGSARAVGRWRLRLLSLLSSSSQVARSTNAFKEGSVRDRVRIAIGAVGRIVGL